MILSRSVVDHQYIIPGTEVTVDSLLAPGLVRFVPVENDENDENLTTEADLGRLSAPYIWVWALHQRAKKRKILPDDSSLYSWTFLEYNQIANALGLGNHTHTSFQSWENFEVFCAQFRALRARVLEDGKEVDLRQMHAGARFCDEKFPEQESPEQEFPEFINHKFINHHLIMCQAKHQQSTKSSSMRSTTKCNVIVERTHPSRKEESETIDFKMGTTCVINGKSTPAGDIWLYLDGPSVNEVH